MPNWETRRPCPRCPYDGWVTPGVKHVRCDECRADHARGKAADAQWDRRARRRAERADERRRRGFYVEPLDGQIRPRERTPTWDQFGNDIDDVPRLTPTETRRLRAMLEQLDRAVAEALDALGPER